MSQDELIKVARKHAVGFAQDDKERALVATLTDVQVKTAALIRFRAPGSKAAVDVYLDSETGEFVTGSFSLGR
jgi:hypothetical protein